MLARDFSPDRLEAAKNVAVDFVNKRLTDRIAIVIFSGESFTQCPLTTDHTVLISAIENGLRTSLGWLSQCSTLAILIAVRAALK